MTTPSPTPLINKGLARLGTLQCHRITEDKPQGLTVALVLADVPQLRETAAATANLMAASQDLLDALRPFAALSYPTPKASPKALTYTKAHIQAARAAIAKACPLPNPRPILIPISKEPS